MLRTARSGEKVAAAHRNVDSAAGGYGNADAGPGRAGADTQADRDPGANGHAD